MNLRSKLLLPIFLFYSFAGAKEIATTTPAPEDGRAGSFVIHGEFDPAKKPHSGEIASQIRGTITVGHKSTEGYWNITLSPVAEPLNLIYLDIRNADGIVNVTGDGLRGWGIRQMNGGAQLGLAFEESRWPTERILQITTRTEHVLPLESANFLQVYPPVEGLSRTTLQFRVDKGVGLDFEHGDTVKSISKRDGAVENFLIASFPYDLQASAQTVPINNFTIEDYRIKTTFGANGPSHLWSGDITVHTKDGVEIPLLLGTIALNEIPEDRSYGIQADEKGIRLQFAEAGSYSVEIPFTVKAKDAYLGSSLSFTPVAGTVRHMEATNNQKTTLQVTVNQSVSILSPEESTDGIALSSEGPVEIRWMVPRKATATKAFYTVDGASTLTVANGALEQEARFAYTLTQGSLQNARFQVKGEADILDLTGPSIRDWSVEQAEDGTREILVAFSQSQSGNFLLQIKTRRILETFPVEVVPTQLIPVGAQRFSGFLRIDFDTETKIDVLDTAGLSQVTPNLFPAQRFGFQASTGERPAIAFRHGGAEYDLTLRAEPVTPELFQSITMLHETDFSGISLSASFDVEIREAAVSMIPVEVPSGFMVLSVVGGDVEDYQVIESEGKTRIQIYLRGKTKGRTAFEIEMEKPGSFEAGILPVQPVQIPGANLVRGFVGVGATDGIRVQVQGVKNLTEIASAFLPRYRDQASFAWRMQQDDWELLTEVSMVEQSIRLDNFRLLSLAEETLYGSAIFNFVVTGAPLTELRFELPDGYDNPDFQGEGIRSWTLVDRTATLRFQSPLSGAFTILATYESPITPNAPFPAAGPTPLLSADEQGYLAFVSHYPFEIADQTNSDSVEKIEARDLPEEWRLLYSAPLIAAYRYDGEAPKLSVALRSLPGMDSLQQNIESFTARTRINPSGELITEMDLILRSIQRPYLALNASEGTRLWEAKVAGVAVTPVIDGDRTLIPLPATSGPDGTIPISIISANRGKESKTNRIALPVFPAPIQDFSWTVSADGTPVPVFRDGPLAPINAPQAPSAQGGTFAIGLFCFGVGVSAFLLFLRMAIQNPSWVKRFVFGAILAVCALVVLLGTSIMLDTNLVNGHPVPLPDQLEFSGKVIPASESIYASVTLTDPDGATGFDPSFFWIGTGAILFIAAFFVNGARLPALALSAAGLSLIVFGFLASYPVGWTLLVIGIIALLAQALVIRRLRLPATKTTAALLLVILGLGSAGTDQLSAAQADRITHDLEMKGNQLVGETVIEWNAKAGEEITLVPEGTRVTSIEYDENVIELVRTENATVLARAKTDGSTTLRFEAVWESVRKDNQNSLRLNAGPALRIEATLQGKDLERYTFSSPESVEEQISEKQDSITFRFQAGTAPTLIWALAKREPENEPLRFFSDSNHVFTPIGGVVLGDHQFALSFAQGQSSSFSLTIPQSQIVTSVESKVSHTWEFNPETGVLEILPSQPVSTNFVVRVMTEKVKSNLPYEVNLELPRITGAESSLGTVFLATPSEVEVTEVKTEAMSPSGADGTLDGTLAKLVGEALTVRERFRFGNTEASLSFTARAVAPEIHIEAKQILSLGEDRTLLSYQGIATVEQAGLFSMRFSVPAPFDVESISATNLAYWTKDTSEDGLGIVLHFQQKILGTVQLALSFSGPGADRMNNGPLPAIRFDNVKRESGFYQIAPELGLKVTVDPKTAAIQVDPQEQGINKRGGHLIRLLSKNWVADYEIEKLRSWIETQSLSRVTVDSSRVEYQTTFSLDIENAGVKELHLAVPPNHSSLVVEHPNLSHFRRVDGENDTLWKVVFDRRIIGTSALTVTYFADAVPTDGNWMLTLPRLTGVDRSSAFAAVFTNPRLDLTPDEKTESSRALWTNIPESLRGRTTAPASGLVFRIIDSEQPIDFAVRNLGESESLLKARVLAVNARTILAEAGIALTETTISIQPQNQRYLPLEAKEGTTIWSAFVNGQNVRLWKDGERILVPLAKSSVPGSTTTLKIITGTLQEPLRPGHDTDYSLRLPDLGLPLENIEWLVHVPQEWRISEDTIESTLNIAGFIRQTPNQQQINAPVSQAEDMESARELFGLGSSYLKQGKTEDANRAFESAYNLSQNDISFNADALVQWNEVRKQQALSGLSQRRSKVANQLSDNDTPQQMSQQQTGAVQVESAESAKGLALVVQQLIEQQNAALPTPAQFNLTVPGAINYLRLERVVAVDPWTDLTVSFETKSAEHNQDDGRAWIALVAFAFFLGIGYRFSKSKG